MKKTMTLYGIIGVTFLGVVAFALWAKVNGKANQSQEQDKSGFQPQSVLDFTMNTIDGTHRSLSEYRGDVLLIVNTASKCGFTPQYTTLEQLYETYKDKGFRILAFPANNFLWQEPGTNQEIKKFCSENYSVTFDLFEKISVRGNDKHPLYKYITESSPFRGEVKWNFQKYLVNRKGEIVARYAPSDDPMSKGIIARVEELLAERPQ